MRSPSKNPITFLGPVQGVKGIEEGKRVVGYTFEVLSVGSSSITLKYPDKKTATEMRRQIARTDGAHIVVSKPLFEAIRQVVFSAS